MRVCFVGRQIAAHEGNIDAVRFELVGKLRVARQRLQILRLQESEARTVFLLQIRRLFGRAPF